MTLESQACCPAYDQVDEGHDSGPFEVPCPEKHFTTVHLTPSNPRYELNKRKWLVRRTCWEAKS
jgi:hypothetical protein